MSKITLERDPVATIPADWKITLHDADGVDRAMRLQAMDHPLLTHFYFDLTGRTGSFLISPEAQRSFPLQLVQYLTAPRAEVEEQGYYEALLTNELSPQPDELIAATLPRSPEALDPRTLVHLGAPGMNRTFCGRDQEEAPRAYDLCSLPAGGLLVAVREGWCPVCIAELLLMEAAEKRQASTSAGTAALSSPPLVVDPQACPHCYPHPAHAPGECPYCDCLLDNRPTVDTPTPTPVPPQGRTRVTFPMRLDNGQGYLVAVTLNMSCRQHTMSGMALAERHHGPPGAPGSLSEFHIALPVETVRAAFAGDWPERAIQYGIEHTVEHRNQLRQRAPGSYMGAFSPEHTPRDEFLLVAGLWPGNLNALQYHPPTIEQITP